MMALYGFLKPSNISFSQKGEDILVHCFFSRRNYGYYLDIGCFHPRWISNTCLLHRKGWEGTVVDLDQYKLNLFKFVRGSKVNTIRAAITAKEGKDSFINVYKFFSKRGWSDVDTTSLETAEMLKENGRGPYNIEKIKSIGINNLLAGLPKVDFLNVDIEGIDTQVINQIDLRRFKIDLIIFEDNENYGGEKNLRKKLEDNGYFHLFTSGGSVCFALKNKIPIKAKVEN